jgi:hypothetical protein
MSEAARDASLARPRDSTNPRGELGVVRRHHSPIPQFPQDIDRRDFGNWLAGFADGEGSFGLRCLRGNHDPKGMQRCPGGIFQICLRDDDRAILELIRSFWQIGNIDDRPASGGNGRSRGVSHYRVNRLSHLLIVVDHFNTSPLWAKKRLDFAIWSRAVKLMAKVAARPNFDSRGRKKRQWSDEERAEFLGLMAALKNQRCYRLPPKVLDSENRSAFGFIG